MDPDKKKVKDMKPGDRGYIGSWAVFFDSQGNPYLDTSNTLNSERTRAFHIYIERTASNEYHCMHQDTARITTKGEYIVNRHNLKNIVPLTPEGREVIARNLGKNPRRHSFDYEFQDPNLEMQVEAALDNHERAAEIRDKIKTS